MISIIEDKLNTVFSDKALDEAILCFVSSKAKEKKYFLSKDCLVHIAFDMSEGLSEDEAGSFFSTGFDFYNFLDLVLEASEQFLFYRFQSIFVKPGHMIGWKEIAEKHGEDIFICAYLAKSIVSVQEGSGGRYISNLDWPYSLSSGDARLLNCLEKGVSENHLHLNGSGPSFYLNWVVLNNEENISRLFNKNQEKQFLKEYPERDFASFRNDCLLASAIRSLLFIYAYHFDSASSPNKLNPFNNDLIGCFSDWKSGGSLLNSIHYLNIAKLKRTILMEARLEVNRSFYDPGPDDYAFTLAKFGNKESIETGERAFILWFFIHYRDVAERIRALLYIYLSLKEKIASRFYETNDKLGFANFSHYQKICDFFYKGTKYDRLNPFYLAKWMLQTKNTINGEIRLAPKIDISKNKKSICIKDKSIQDAIGIVTCEEKSNRKSPCFFFTFHFIKEPDEKIMKDIAFTDAARYNKLRKKSIKEAKSILALVENNTVIIDDNGKVQPYHFRKFVRGIDAANSERNARPEVFGPAYRLLKDHWYYDCWSGHFSKPKFGYTYHVGEDFSGIINGLRAIHDAITYLNLSFGDRLGHCVALGVNPDEYAKFKFNRALKNKQEALDDYVWALHYLCEYGFSDTATIAKLTDDTVLLGKELYGSVFAIVPYFNSFALRSDYPDIYPKYSQTNGYTIFAKSIFERAEQLGSTWMVNSSNPMWKTACGQKEAIDFFNQYEFSVGVREKGQETICVEITKGLIDASRFLQGKLHDFIATKGLIIETNPTSNFLIGPFNKYSDLPIFSFNNYGLGQSGCFKSNIAISVCTDDQGIFRTSLSGEYSIILELLRSNCGELGFNNEIDIETAYQYIDYLRKLSNDVSFGDNR